MGGSQSSEDTEYQTKECACYHRYRPGGSKEAIRKMTEHRWTGQRGRCSEVEGKLETDEMLWARGRKYLKKPGQSSDSLRHRHRKQSGPGK